MPLSTQDVIKLSQQAPLTTNQVQGLASSVDTQNKAIASASNMNQSVQQMNSGVPTSSAITPASLAPATPIVPVTATETPIPSMPENPPAPVAPVAPPPTPLADQLSALIGDTVKGNNALLGRSADTSALNESLGVNAKTDVINGLSSQLTGLINESKAIPLQIQQNAQAGGANVTKGGLAPIQTASLRNNAIQSLAVSSQMDAARGDLATAISKVDRAMQAKYGPLEEANKARLANLDLLSKDPALTREEKARADFMTAKAEADKQKIADAKAVETAKHDAVLKAYSALSTNPKFDSITQAAINAAKTDMEVTQILASRGLSTVPEAAGFELSAGQTRYDAKGNIIASRPDKVTGSSSSVGLPDAGLPVGSVRPDGTIVTKEDALTASAKDWITQFNSGAMELNDIYTKIGSAKESLPLRNEVARLVAAQKGKRVYGADDASIQAIQSQIKNVEDLLYKRDENGVIDKTKTGGYGKIVGQIQGGGGFFLPDVWNTGKQDVLAIAKNLVSNQTLQALADAKAKGITFGALSERELGVVAEAASRIAAKIQRKNKDFPDEVTGFSGSESQFKKDLLTILQGEDGTGGLKKSIADKTGTLGTSTQFAPDEMSQLNSIFNADVDPSKFY